MTYQQTQWRLNDLFSGHDSADLEQAFNQVDGQVTSFEAARSMLHPDMEVEQFLHILRASEAIQRIIDRLSAFAYLSFQANTQDQAAQVLQARVEQFVAETQNRTVFFSLWWKQLDDHNAQRLMDASGDYRYYLEQMRSFRPHTLSEAEEKILNLKNVTGVSALNRLYASITNRYVFKLTVDGEARELTRDELSKYTQGADPDLRARAYQELYRVYGADGPILGQIYQALVRDWRNENMSLRRFSHPIAARNLVNDIPDDVVRTLVTVALRNGGLFQRYFRLKAKHLGIRKLRRYDIHAPVGEPGRKFEFEASAQMVLEAYASFDPKLAELAGRVFEEQHLDGEIRQGKGSGAFCYWITPEMTPYVLLNYGGHPDDVATMAHELGHALHTMLSRGHSVFTFGASLPLAETASAFGEMLLLDQLLSREADESVRRYLLFKQVADAYETIMRQAYLTLFEEQAHEMICKNATVDELCAVYLKNLKDQFGDSVEVTDEFMWEWVSVPHFYEVPFYVYAYAFGLLLVLSLYRQFKAEGDEFKPRYLRILSAGGSDAPARILAEAGIDFRAEKFWQGGFDVLDQWIEALEKSGP